jgi:putative endonuclease
MTATSPQGARSERGRIGEDATLHRYRDRGFDAVARNWRCPLGELDLVVARAGLLVFCEVKTRLGTALGGGHDAVTWKKQRKLRQLAEVFLAAHRLDPARIRFDVASVSVDARGRADVELFEDAF